MKKTRVRLFIVSLGSITLCGVLMTLCALVTNTQQAAWTSQLTASASIHPLDRTATWIVGNATATMQARQNPFIRFLNLVFPPPPPTPIPTVNPTLAAIYAATQQALATASGPNPLDLTTTAIILNATATEVANRAATQYAMGIQVENWMELTATAIILNAAATEVANRAATWIASGLNSLDLTATAIVLNATTTQQAITIAALNPLDATATAIVLNATETSEPGYQATRQALATATPTTALTPRAVP